MSIFIKNGLVRLKGIGMVLIIAWGLGQEKLDELKFKNFVEEIGINQTFLRLLKENKILNSLSIINYHNPHNLLHFINTNDLFLKIY